MKSTILKTGLAALALLITVTSCSKKEGFTIKGTIFGLEKGTIYLEKRYENGNQKITDSAQIKGGAFVFEGKVDEPLVYTLKLKGQDFFAFILLDNEEIKIEAKVDSIYAAKITGGAENDIVQSFYKNEEKKIGAISTPIYKLTNSLEQYGKVELTTEQQSMIDKKWQDFRVFADDLVYKFVLKNKDKIAAALIINWKILPHATPEQVKKHYAVLSPEVQKSYYGKQLKATMDVNDKTAPGAVAPEFSQTDIDGKIVKLSDYKGKYVLVDFWTSWCGPCRRENPNVVMAYKTYHDKGFNVLGVSFDDKKELWKEAIQKDGLTWTNVSDLKGAKSEVATLYGVKVVPTNYLIGPDGKIISKNLMGAELQSKLKEIFGKF